MAGITVRNKVLLYLGKYSGIDYCEYDMPKDLTQDGISAALAISRAHASIEVKKLLNKEWATVRLAHSKGYSSKRKVYFLTPEGIAECKALSDALSSAGTDFSSFFLETQMNKTVPSGRIIEARSEIRLAAEAADDRKLTESIVHMTKAIQQIAFELGSERNGDA